MCRGARLEVCSVSPVPTAYLNRKLVAVGIEVHVLAASPQLMQCWVAMNAGTELPVHSHPHAQASYVVKGKVRWLVDGQPMDGPAGSSIIFLPGQPHGALVLEDCEVVDSFAPPRDEYLH